MLPGDTHCNLHDLRGHISWVGSVLYRSCTTSHNGKEELNDLDHNLSIIPQRRRKTLEFSLGDEFRNKQEDEEQLYFTGMLGRVRSKVNNLPKAPVRFGTASTPYRILR